jgi:Protein of unknown function (DUF3016)
MKRQTSLLMLSIRASILILSSGIGSLPAAPVAPVTIQFVNPAKFTDFEFRRRDANYTASLFAGNVKDELTPLMRQKYPHGSLLLRFTDIDLAGRYSSARGVRVMTVGHPARMSFDFLLTGANGKVLAKGSTRLTDNSNPSSGRYDPKRSQLFYYERRTLNRWLRTLSTSR